MAASMLGELSCSVCLETFTDPVTLPCMHSFCRHCLIDLLRSESSHDLYTVINCPECRQTTRLGVQGVNGLPKNCTLANLVEKFINDKNKRKRHDPNCSVCDRDPPRFAVKVCFDCNLSYCGDCISWHPNRGVLATHVLEDVNADDRSTPKLIIRKDARNNDKRTFCHTCNELIQNRDSGHHQRLRHRITGLRRARQEKFTSLEEKLEKMEKTRKDFRRNVYFSETFIEQTSEEKEKQISDLTDVIDGIRNDLGIKESKLIHQIKEEGIESVKETELEIRNKKPLLAHLTDIINVAQTLMEQNLDDFNFLENAVVLEERMVPFEDQTNPQPVQKSVKVSNTVVKNVKKMASTIRKTMDNEQGKSDAQSKNKVRIFTVNTIVSKNPELVSIDIKWRHSYGNKFNVKVSCCSSNGCTETRITTGVTSHCLTVCNLLPDTKYDIAVSVHDQPDTEEILRNYKTLATALQKVQNVSVIPKWKYGSGQLHVQWTAMPQEEAYDVKLLRVDSTSGDENETTIMYSYVTGTHVFLCNLFEDTEYHVTVMVHEHPESESEQINAKTLPRLSENFIFDVSHASDSVEFNRDGTVMLYNDQPAPCCHKLHNVLGTTGSRCLSLYDYWQVDLRTFLGRLQPHGESAFEIGICQHSKADNIRNIRRNFFAYICCLFRRGNDAFLDFFAKGKLVKTIEFNWEKPFQFVLGCFFNLPKQEFSIIDTINDTVYMTFTNIKVSGDYMAVFDTGDGGGRTKCEVNLTCGSDLSHIPSIVHSTLM